MPTTGLEKNTLIAKQNIMLAMIYRSKNTNRSEPSENSKIFIAFKRIVAIMMEIRRNNKFLVNHALQ